MAVNIIYTLPITGSFTAIVLNWLQPRIVSWDQIGFETRL